MYIAIRDAHNKLSLGELVWGKTDGSGYMKSKMGNLQNNKCNIYSKKKPKKLWSSCIDQYYNYLLVCTCTRPWYIAAAAKLD